MHLQLFLDDANKGLFGDCTAPFISYLVTLNRISLLFLSALTVPMSIWDAFTGRKSSSSSSSSASSASSTRSSNTLPSQSPSPYTPAPFDPSVAQDVSSFLGSASLPDASQLHPLAGLNQQTLDYLSLDESTLSDLPGSRSALPSRGWSDDLCYGTGVTYLTALTMGGTWGLVEGLNRSPASAPPKLRVNSVLNSVTRRGPFLGNSAGVVAMVYNGVNSTIGYYRGKHDSANSIVAGALSGMLFKSTRGVRPMMVSGGIVAGVAGGWAVSLTDLYSSQASTEY
jgi:mitochondrial import inner membrane translocase subunit TIM23